MSLWTMLPAACSGWGWWLWSGQASLLPACAHLALRLPQPCLHQRLPPVRVPVGTNL